jgi:nitrate reductase NapE component
MNNRGKMPLLNKIRAFENKSLIIKFLIVFVALFVFYNIPREYLFDETNSICLYRTVVGKRCLGCGTTRAVWSILHLKTDEAIEYNKLIIIIFPLLVGSTISWITKKRKNRKS